MHIGVIASMKRGLEQFVYRELLFLEAQGFKISLFPTKFQRGLYNAPPEWRVQRWQPLVVALMQPLFFLRAPGLYVRLLWEALTTRSLVDFAVAWYFAPRMSGVDLIYSTFGDRKLYVGYFCKKIVHKPLAVTVHAYELYQNPNPRLFERALRACDQVITVTDYNRDILATRYGIDPSRVEVVRYGIDTRDYRPEEKFIILIVGFFVERKGHEVLFKALKQLDRDDIEVWVVGGEGAEKPVDVPAMAAALGVSARVAFFGKLGGNALRAAYRACDVFCLPCHTDSVGVAEGFPNVIIEAMAMGKPVITTRHVGIPEVVKEILVDENDVAGLAQAIRQVYESPALRERLGHANRTLAEEIFSRDNARRTAQIMRGLVEGAPRSEPPELSASLPAEAAERDVEVARI